jgi:hypothetical protein
MYTGSLTRPSDPPLNRSAGRGPQTSIKSFQRTPTRALRGSGPLNSNR